MKDLMSRYEEPNQFQRWDRPLFYVQPDDALLPFDGIHRALFETACKPPNVSTILKPVQSLNTVTTIECGTKSIVQHVLAQQPADAVYPLEVPMPKGIKGASSTVPLMTLRQRVTLAELRRHTRQFRKLQDLHPNAAQAEGGVEALFLAYLKAQLQA